MARTKISEFSATPANNTDIDSINIAEGCAPSGINDAIRELMAQLKDFQTGAVGDSFNGPIGTSTAAAGAFTTLSASGTATLSGLTASTALALDASKNIVSVTNTGTGSNVLATSPTLVTPILGTPTSATLTNATGLPIATGVSGLGTGIATALAVNVGSSGAPLVNGGVLGTPSSGTATNLTGLPLTTGVTGTLPTANGGTNLTSFTSGGVVYASSSSALATGSALTFNGTAFATTATGSFTGNLAVAGGAVPVASGFQNGIAVGTGGTIATRSASSDYRMRLGTNFNLDGTHTNTTTNPVSLITMDNGITTFSIGALGTAGNAISYTDAMTLTAAGNVGIGTSTFATNSKFAVQTSAGKLDVVSEGSVSVKLLAGSGGMTLSAPSGLFFDTSGTQQFEARDLQLYSNGTIKATTSISVGNAVPTTSGAGITFPATQSASSNANTLDDYEEGTFTPTVTFSGNAVGLTYQTDRRHGRYTKIGNRVYISINVELSNKGSSTGDLNIEGLPFATENIAFMRYVAANQIAFLTGVSGDITSAAPGNSTVISSFTFVGTGTQSTVTNTNCTNDLIVALTMHYTV
jgi:hypothetical protein